LGARSQNGTPGTGRRWGVAIGTTIALLLLLRIGNGVFLRAIEGDWPNVRHSVDSTLTASISREINSYFQAHEAYFQALQNGAETRVVLAHGTPKQRSDALLELQALPRPAGAAFEIRDRDGVLAAFAGTVLPAQGAPVTEPFSLSLRTHGFFVVLLFEGIVSDQAGKPIGIVRTAAPLTIHVPASNRYFDDQSLHALLMQHFGSEIALDVEGNSPHRLDGRYLPIPLRLGDRAPCTAYTLRTNPVEYTRTVQRHFDRAEAFLVMVLLLLCGLLFHMRILRRLQPGARFLGSFALAVALRWALFLSDAMAQLLPEALLNPAIFASSLGGGIVSSIGELTVTLLFVFAIVLAGAQALREADDEPAGFRLVSWLWLGLIPLAIPVLLRGYAASIQSFVTDSSFNFDDLSPLLSNPLFLLMLVDLFLLSVSFVLMLLLLSRAQRRMLDASGTGSVARGWYAAAAMMAPLLPFLLLTRNLLLPVETYLLLLGAFAIGVAGRATLPALRAWRPVPLLLAVWIGSSLCASLLLHHFMHLRRLAEIEVMAEQLARPIDGWSASLAEQAAMQMQASAGAWVPDALQGEAFSLWSNSILSSQANNSAVLLLDGEGREWSRFSAGIDPRDVQAGTLRAALAGSGDTAVAMRRSSEMHRGGLYAVQAAIPGSPGGSGATLLVVVESLDPLRATQQPVDLLRSTTAARSLAPEDRCAVSVFRRGFLTASSDPDIPRGLPLPAGVASAVERGARPWSTVTTTEAALPALFVRAGSDSTDAVIGVSAGDPQFLFSFYRWLRIALMFFAMLLLLVVSSGARRGWRSRLRRLPFSARVRLSLLAVASIPLLLVWTSARRFVSDGNERIVQQQLLENLHVLRANLRDNPARSSSLLVTDADCFAIAERTGRDMNVYTGTELAASSRPELYAAGLLQPRLHPEAHRAIAVLGQEFCSIAERIGDVEYFVGYLGIRDSAGAYLGAISTPTLFEQHRAEEASIRASAVMSLGSGIIVLLVLVVSTALARQISKPLRALTAATKDIAHGNLEKRVRLSASPEIEELVSSFNTMTEQLLVSRNELAVAERELAWKEMAKVVAHEIRNPLTPMRLAAQHLQRAADDNVPDLRELISKLANLIIDQIDTLTRISEEFSRFARMPGRTPVELDIAALLVESASLFRHHEHISFVLLAAEALPSVRADREELSRAVTNILRNAVQAIGEEGTITITAARADDGVTVVVTDTGSGIAPELLPRIFEPNFSTKTEGMGLGLAIVKKIIDDIGGSIRIESEQGAGCTVTLSLPGVAQGIG
jgi:signal transduction histidine kinase